MISEGYDPRRINPRIARGRIDNVTQEYVAGLGLTEADKTALRQQLIGTCKCPPSMSFRATPETIRLLRLDREAKPPQHNPQSPEGGASEMTGESGWPFRVRATPSRKAGILKALLRRS